MYYISNSKIKHSTYLFCTVFYLDFTWKNLNTLENSSKTMTKRSCELNVRKISKIIQWTFPFVNASPLTCNKSWMALVNNFFKDFNFVFVKEEYKNYLLMMLFFLVKLLVVWMHLREDQVRKLLDFHYMETTTVKRGKY